ncbi:MAG: hypothetical protein JWN04_6214 [Myxococcaceae bacterium]|nr:hypothetical protein [Myxococcaceae bacterium]
MSGERDPLERATRALREATPPTQDELAAGRARLLAGQRGALKSARIRTLRWVLPLAAVLAGGSALAATPEAFERVARALSSLLAPEAGKLAAAKPKRAQFTINPAAKRLEAPPPAPASTQTPAPAPAEPVVREPELERADAEPTPAERSARRQRRARSAERAPREVVGVESRQVLSTEPAPAEEHGAELAIDRDLASYREAHRAHFRARDFSAALQKWDAYLADYPHGNFVVEARYNRAICLVRLGHKDDARRALTPFAQGAVEHGYRQAGAKMLLEALE